MPRQSIASIDLPTVIYNGKTAVTTAGTRVPLTTTQAVLSGVNIKALAGNSGIIYVGNATVAAANGFQLAAGQSVFLEVANLATVYLDAGSSGEGVSWIAT